MAAVAHSRTFRYVGCKSLCASLPDDAAPAQVGNGEGGPGPGVRPINGGAAVCTPLRHYSARSKVGRRHACRAVDFLFNQPEKIEISEGATTRKIVCPIRSPKSFEIRNLHPKTDKKQANLLKIQ